MRAADMPLEANKDALSHAINYAVVVSKAGVTLSNDGQ